MQIGAMDDCELTNLGGGGDSVITDESVIRTFVIFYTLRARYLSISII